MAKFLSIDRSLLLSLPSSWSSWASSPSRPAHRPVPEHRPPEIYINTTYVGADAQAVEQSVATPSNRR